MSASQFSGLRVGFIGGGQLARMAVYRTKKLGLNFFALDPDPQCGVAGLVDKLLVGSLYDEAKLRQLAELSDVLTYDIEHVGVEALIRLEAEGVKIFPSPQVLAVLQDKVEQKKLYLDHGLPVAPFVPKAWSDLTSSDLPVVQKSRRGGYDGRGVAVVRSLDREPKLSGETFFEEYVPFERELAVMVARAQDGQTVVYPVVEMLFDPQMNICDEVLAPARVSPEISGLAAQLALEAVRAVNGVGVFGVELFLTREGKLLVNEMAPRPHNSGHYTMESCQVCQFENHLRAVCGLPLASPGFFTPAVMANLLGSGSGTSVVSGLVQALALEGFSLHLYGKAQCRPGRKMGHFTVTAPTPEQALERCREVKRYLKVTGA